MKNFFYSEGFFHLIIALVILPFQQGLPEFIKLSFLPYVLFLVFRKDPVFLPTLIVYVTGGTTIMFAVLFSVLLITLVNIRELVNSGLKNLLILSFLPLPIFVYMTYVRVFEMGTGIRDTLVPLDMYLGIFPFFYGALLIQKFDLKSLNGIYFTLFILPFYFLYQIINFEIRLYWLSYPIFLTVIIFFFFLKLSQRKIDLRFSLFGLMFLLLAGLPKFTVFFSGLLGAFIAYFKFFNMPSIFSFFTRGKVILLFIAILAYVIINAEQQSATLFEQNINLADVDEDQIIYFDSWKSFNDNLYYKSFGDRAPIWLGGWSMILNSSDNYFFPPYEPKNYSFITTSGLEIQSENLAVHNLLLELMRQYGLCIGALIFLIFMLFLVKGPGAYIINSKVIDSQLLLLAAGTIGSGLGGALVGQYCLMGTFSISMISIFGIFYSLSRLNLETKFN